MAIDDNTSYELTGAQVKDLANKIKAKAADNIFVGATSAAPGSKGLVPAPQAGDDTKYLKGDGTWGAVQAGPTDTTFYFNSSTSTVPASTVHVYKDQAMTQMANGGDIETAFKTGRVLVVDLYGNGDESGVIISLDTEDGSKLYFYMAGLGAQQQRLLAFADAVDTSPYYGIYNLQDRLTAGSNIQISGDTISATDTTYSAFGGATSSVAGSAGLVPAPAAGDEGKVLHGDGTWKDTTAKLVEMSYGESNAWAKFIAAYNAGSIVYCRASSNANPATGTQGRKAFMAYVNNATAPTEVEFQYVRSVSSKTDSQQSDQVFIYKLTNASGGTWTVATRNMATKINVSGPITKTFTTGANATIEIGASAMTGATSGAAGTAGVVPAPAAGSQDKFLRGDGTWAAAGGSNGRITLYASPGLSVYDPGDTITLYKDAAETQQITTLQELGALVDSGIVVIRDRSNDCWTLSFWYDESTSGWYSSGVFVADGEYGEKYRLVWDPDDGNVLKLDSVTYFLAPSSYSTSEAATSEKWIDGKRIYRKTIDIGALPNASGKQVNHGISGLDTIVKMEGFAKDSNAFTPLPFPGTASNPAGFIQVGITSTAVSIGTGTDRSNATGYVTLYYTKS